MPEENTVNGVNQNYYQVCICGDARRHFFIEEEDITYFLSLFEKFLTDNELVELAVYCLDPFKISLLLCQINSGGIAKLMHKIINSYNDYYYDKYRFEDLLSESDYLVSVVAQTDVLDISRKIHLNSENWVDYPHSSLRAYLYDDVPSWLVKNHITKIYGSAVSYFDFLNKAI